MRSSLKYSSPVLAALALSACWEHTVGEPNYDYEVEIRRDAHGVPHIKAENMASVAYGSGYSIAQDHGCTIAEQMLKVNSQMAEFYGPGEDDKFLNSDLAYLHIGVYQKAQEHWPELDQEIRDIIVAYAAGYNRYLDEVGSEGFASECAGEPWVRQITEIDLYAYFRELALLASGRQFLDYIATAQPPGSGLQLPAPGLEALAALRDSPFGSNGWGIGSDLSATGGGMLLANPHFPWQGELRLWESHYTVPGELDVYGASLLGVPVVLIGFNDAVAWSHTVSAGQRFTFYRLDLDPEDPTSYLREGEFYEMESQNYTVSVLQDDGSTSEVSRTLYRTPLGPVLNINPFGWTGEYAFTYRDGNIDNTSLIPQFFAMNKARSLDQFKAAHQQHLGIPWVNTISTSAEGKAWYIDSTPTPNLSQEAIDAWQQRLDEGEFFTDAFNTLSTFVLEYVDSRDDWVEEAGARSPGLVPWSKLPQLERTDFVFNANDSHWMSNPDELLEGYSPLHGWEGTARTVRTRMNATVLSAGSEGFAGEDGKFDLEELKSAALANQSMSAILIVDQLVERCTATSSISYEGSTVDLSEACGVLAAWDKLYDLDSSGAVLFREWLGDFDAELFSQKGVVFDVPFDPADPVGTPNTLTPAAGVDDDRALRALAAAQGRLGEASIALDATLGEVQFTLKGDQEIPVHGGGRREGITNMISYSTGYLSGREPGFDRGEMINGSTGLSEKGYVINYGTSFIMTLAFGEAGPEAYSFLTYSQSGDSESEYFSDQTELFSTKSWKKILFSEEDLAAAELETVTLQGFADRD